jgi:hypothetical protein
MPCPGLTDEQVKFHKPYNAVARTVDARLAAPGTWRGRGAVLAAVGLRITASFTVVGWPYGTATGATTE